MTTDAISGEPTHGAEVAPMPTPSDSHPHIFGLDVVRASAISLVIVSHMLKPIEPLGTIGVELFFVLSGYLVGGIFLRGILSRQAGYGAMLLAFWKRRWARTLPNYFLFMILWLPVFPQVDKSWQILLQYSVFSQNLWYPVGDFFQISWSLAVEEWFYIILPGLATLLLLMTRQKVAAIAAVVALLIIGCAGARLVPDITDFNRGMRMVVVYRLDALAFGVLGAMLAQLRPDLWRRCGQMWPIGLIGLGVLSFVLARYQLRMTNLEATLLFSALPMSTLLLVARSVSLVQPRGILNTIVGNISKWSYSMYLSHIPIFFLLYDLPGYGDYGAAAKLLVKMVGVALILAVSALVYHRFELPMLDRFSPRRAPH